MKFTSKAAVAKKIICLSDRQISVTDRQFAAVTRWQFSLCSLIEAESKTTQVTGVVIDRE
jgi:hypothetical protein